MAGAPSTRSGRGSLTRRLVLRVVVLVALIAALLSLFTALATRALLTDQVDDQLAAAQGRVMRGDARLSYGGPGEPPPGIDLPGQPVGTLLIVYVGGQAARGSVLAESRRQARPTSVSVQVAARLAGNGPGRPVTGELPDLGRYRYLSWRPVDGVQFGVGLPLTGVDAVLANLITVEIILSLIAVGAAAIVGQTLIERSLRPLNRVAATAQQVS
ncbi:MAG: two-component sensor histidine kinase, partial [Microlunatus sp.]|nr:two-component sensor histidine kinase [Microlunatus sp.]